LAGVHEQVEVVAVAVGCGGVEHDVVVVACDGHVEEAAAALFEIGEFADAGLGGVVTGEAQDHAAVPAMVTCDQCVGGEPVPGGLPPARLVAVQRAGGTAIVDRQLVAAGVGGLETGWAATVGATHVGYGQ
jgi:hypothetical protein